MKVRDLLKDFYGDTKIQIREAGTDETHECRNYRHARLEYGHYEVSNWHMEDDVLDILVQCEKKGCSRNKTNKTDKTRKAHTTNKISKTCRIRKTVGDYERHHNDQHHECPYSDKDDVDDCMNYFMGECQNTCSFCPMEDKYGVIW